MSLLDSLKNQCEQFGFDRTYWLAFSGGMDSHVLLHLLVSLRQQYPLRLRAIHINHGLSPNAEAWSEHCAQVCASLAVELSQQKIQITADSGASLEDVARQKRYAAISALLSENDLLFTAHHQDDQAETVMLQLLRGAGPKGLAAMPRLKSLGNGFQVRPLLNFPRRTLQEYAMQHQLRWIEDESNNNHHFSRNFIRHEVMPILQKRWSGVTATLARSAENCAEAQELLEEIAAQDWMTTQGSVAKTLSIKKLLSLSAPRQRQVMRFWLKQLNFPLPSAVKLQQAQQDMLLARADRFPHVTWEGVELRRYRDDLYALTPLVKHDVEQVVPWDLRQPLWLQGIGELRAELKTGADLRADFPAITVRFRAGGEVCRLPQRDCTHDLKKLFQTWKVPTWERNRVPLVYAGDRLVAAVGFFIDPEFGIEFTLE